MTLPWIPGPYAGWARIETAVGVLMELCGWDSAKARSRMSAAAVGADASVETIAKALLALSPEHPAR